MKKRKLQDVTEFIRKVKHPAGTHIPRNWKDQREYDSDGRPLLTRVATATSQSKSKVEPLNLTQNISEGKSDALLRPVLNSTKNSEPRRVIVNRMTGTPS